MKTITYIDGVRAENTIKPTEVILPQTFTLPQLAALVREKKIRIQANWQPHVLAKNIALVFEDHLIADNIHTVMVAEAGLMKNSIILGATIETGEIQLCIHHLDGGAFDVELFYDAIKPGESRVDGKSYKTTETYKLFADLVLWVNGEFDLVTNGLDNEVSDAVEYRRPKD